MIQVHGVSKRFASLVLDDVHLSVPRGSLVGLVGPGASGKSVLVKAITGLVRPDAGRIVVDGQELTSLGELELQAARARFGMLFQQNALFDFMTVEGNVAFPLRRLTTLAEPEIRARARDRLARVGLAGFEDRMPAALSGGQKKRVGIARATITDAPIRLYDEPAAGLDPVTSQKIFDLLREEQRAAGATAIMISSDVDRLLSVVDRIVMMVRGRVVFDGPVDGARSSENAMVRQFLRGETEGPL
ncbi:MAG: ATP-binding cassette domain-containing protein [Deltaproteobacteria bacterium]|nr:ATP-binding cassette domain-containing protein [Deltaproteobacteria bacterium]